MRAMALAMGLFACSDDGVPGPDPDPDPGPVTITLLHDGQPIAGGRVHFTGEDGTTPIESLSTDSLGRATSSGNIAANSFATGVLAAPHDGSSTQSRASSSRRTTTS